MAKGRTYQRDAIEFARAMTFFDAVYAFALTLLITTVNDFTPQAWRSITDLLNTNGWGLLSFTISFLVVVQYWRGNHRTMSSFRYIDHRLISMQLVVLFLVILIPFSTEAIGEPGLSDLPLPTAVYALNVAAVSLAQFAILLVADRRDVRDHAMTRPQLRAALASGLVVPLVFLASIPVSFLASPNAARLSWLALPVLAPIVGRLAGGNHPDAESPG